MCSSRSDRIFDRNRISRRVIRWTASADRSDWFITGALRESRRTAASSGEGYEAHARCCFATFHEVVCFLLFFPATDRAPPCETLIQIALACSLGPAAMNSSPAPLAKARKHDLLPLCFVFFSRTFRPMRAVRAETVGFLKR